MMKAKPFSKRMLQAWRQTVASYEKLIKTGDTWRWRNYGECCRLCNVYPSDAEGNMNCAACVLGDCQGKGRMADTFIELYLALVSDTPVRIKQTARARLAAMKAVVNPKLKRRGQEER